MLLLLLHRCRSSSRSSSSKIRLAAYLVEVKRDTYLLLMLLQSLQVQPQQQAAVGLLLHTKSLRGETQ